VLLVNFYMVAGVLPVNFIMIAGLLPLNFNSEGLIFQQVILAMFRGGLTMVYKFMKTIVT
jgi:hypothetical protein